MKNRRRWLFGGVALLLVLTVFLLLQKDNIISKLFSTTDSSLEQGVTQQTANEAKATETVAQELNIPWEVVVLPNGDLLVTERSGTLKRIGTNRQTFTIEGVEHVGEGGLLGAALHPDFEKNSYLYLYLTTLTNGGLINRVERYAFRDNQLAGKQIILTNIPGASNHDGGRIAFGPDSKLYVTTGDAGKPDLAQDTNSLAGKILRLNDDGAIPGDNPFGNAVYSYGHRNPQGIAWDDAGQLWATEHGRSGFQQSGYDELNRIERGGNYGWPDIEGDEQRAGMITPIAHSGPDETWAPAGLAFLDGSLFFTGLRGQSLYEARISEGTVNLTAHFREEYGRLRASVAADGFLYISTSNRDGRGSVKDGDDKVIKISSSLFR